MIKILIVGGSLQSENMGINALTRGLLKGVFDHSDDDIQVKLLSFIVKEKRSLKFEYGDQIKIIEEIPLRVRENFKVLLKYIIFRHLNNAKPINKTVNWRYLYSVYSEADLILDLTAGDSFTDMYGVDRYIYTSFPKFIAIMMKKKLILVPQTIGPFKYKITRVISKYIVNKCNMNYARDIVSYNYLLDNLKVAKTKAVLSPDLAFNMPPSKEDLISNIIKTNSKNQTPLIGLNISALLYNGGYTGRNQFKLKINYQDLINEIINYFITRNCNIILVPHVINSTEDAEDDYSLCKKTVSEIRKYYPYIYTFDEKYKEDQIKAIIGKCDFFIGSRMHACIGAISMGVPTVPVAYSRKFIGIWDIYGMKDCIADAQTMTINEIMSKVDRCYNNRSKIKDVIDINLKNVNEEINSTLKLIMSC